MAEKKNAAKIDVKKPRSEKIYNLFALIHTLLFGVPLLFSGIMYLVSIAGDLRLYNNTLLSLYNNTPLSPNIVNSGITFLSIFTIILMSFLFIVIGIVLYVLSFLGKKDKTKKLLAIKLFVRGGIGLIVVFICYFIFTYALHLFGFIPY